MSGNEPRTFRRVNQYDKLQNRKEHGNTQSNIGFVEATGLLKREHRILEIGSGYGTLLNEFWKRGYHIQGLDVESRCIEAALERWGRELPIRLMDKGPLPLPSDTFDVVMSFDVLEHIPDTDQHLTEVRRVLKAGGVYILQSPNKWTNSVFETIRWRSLTKWRIGHCSLHSYYEFKRRFEKHRLALQFHDVPVVNDYFRNKVRAYLGGPGLILLAVMNPDKLPLSLRTNFYMTARKVGA